MDLILHKPDISGGLSDRYGQAFSKAIELMIVSAYLTEWDSSFKLNKKCRWFRFIIGKDFGITRKSACKEVIGWLRRDQKVNFLVADQIAGFHPKAVFWKEADDQAFAIVGSSNLTAAAFKKNYEANACSKISLENYNAAKRWVIEIEKQSVPVSKSWLEKYEEAAIPDGGNRGSAAPKPGDIAAVRFTLPKLDGNERNN